MSLGIIQETYQDDIQDMITKIHSKNHLINKRSHTLKKRRDFLLTALKDITEGELKLSDSKMSCSTGHYSSIPDDTDQIYKLLDEIASKDQQISELKDNIESLNRKVRNLKVCNDEMQYQLQQKSQFQRTEKLSHSMIVPKTYSSTEKAQATIDRFATGSSFKSSEKDAATPEDRKKLLKRVSMQAAASAHFMSIKGDFTTLPTAFQEIQSNRSLESSRSSNQ